MEIPSNRERFAEQTAHPDKRLAGKTDVAETPLEIRNLDGAVDDALHAWVHERLGRQLGKYAPQIERIEVRFGDENGPKGGIDRCCMIHVVLSALAPVVVEMRAGEDREAFDLAAGRAERALKRTMQKHGFSTKHKRRQRGKHGDADVETVREARIVDEDLQPSAADGAGRTAAETAKPEPRLEEGMTKPKVHKVAPEPTPEPEVTAQPTRVSDDFIEDADEAALDPDELGAWSLRGAVQEGYVPPRGISSVSLMNGAAADNPLTSPNFENEDHTVWEQTIGLTLQEGGIDGTREPAMVAGDDGEPSGDKLTRDLDLNQSTVREASLFDAGSEETAGDTRDPNINADNDSPEHVTVGDEGAPAAGDAAADEASQSLGGRGKSRRPLEGSRESDRGRAATKRPGAASASKDPAR
jgi:putative sigma-54 modulation protein